MLSLLSVLPVLAITAGAATTGGQAASTTEYVVNNTTYNSAQTYVEDLWVEEGNFWVECDLYLYCPVISELHLRNNSLGALWNPMLDEIPSTLHAAILSSTRIAILYDGWIDLECVGPYKPCGANRAAEILGYDIYAKSGETYTDGVYQTGGIYEDADEVTYEWAIMHLYRALGIERVVYDVTTTGVDAASYDINASPLVQYLTMATEGFDTSEVYSTVFVTRTNPAKYLELAAADGLSTADPYTTMTVADFCVMAYRMMGLYGEPVLTEQETYLLLEAYGRELPYYLTPLQLEAVKYLLARGVVDNTVDWKAPLTFEVASEILMRIKDTDSRLTFRDVTITTDASLLAKGYYATEVSTYTAPIVLTNQFADYSSYTTYDYFVEVVDELEFGTSTGYPALPFMCRANDHQFGEVTGSQYCGRVTVKGKSYYHFTAPQDSYSLGNIVYINTPSGNDIPGMYNLQLTAEQGGGYWTFSGTIPDVMAAGTQITGWVHHVLDDGGFPSEYLDYSRKEANLSRYNLQLGLFNSTTYGFSIRVYVDDLDAVKCVTKSGEKKPLSEVPTGGVKLIDGASITREASADSSAYVTFTLRGCETKDAISQYILCDQDSGSYIAYPAFSKNNEQYLVSVEYLEALGAVWEFTRTSESTYYAGVLTKGSPYDMYTDVFISTSGSSTYVIRGTQLTVYPSDTVVVWESNGVYYVDYAVLLGTQRVVSFQQEDGAVSLSRGDQLGGAVAITYAFNVNNVLLSNDTELVTSEYEYLAAAKVYQNGSDSYTRYIYAPATYPLANWLVVENQLDGRIGVFSFYPAATSTAGDSAKALESVLGISVGEDWFVHYTGAAPLAMSEVVVRMDATTGSAVGFDYVGSAETLPDILYCQELDAYLLRVTLLSPGTSYATWVEEVANGGRAPLTSIVMSTAGSSLRDWNYNLYRDGGGSYLYGYALHTDGTSYELHDVSSWAVDSSDLCDSPYEGIIPSFNEWIPAAVGVPGLIGYPTTVSSELQGNDATSVYSGIAHVARHASGTDTLIVTNQDGTVADPTEQLRLAVIHATPHKLWLQSCGFTFQFLAGSPVAPNELGARPNLSTGTAEAPFDWDDFYSNLKLENADGWLSVAIIAVLILLPRFFMFLFIALMTLALISDVKPWQAFCDRVFDPYRLITFGRQNVHEVKLGRVFLMSLFALGMFGLFQNGLILEIIAWCARAISGILSR